MEKFSSSIKKKKQFQVQKRIPKNQHFGKRAEKGGSLNLSYYLIQPIHRLNVW